MVVNQRLHTVASHRIESAGAILDTRQTILTGTYPQAAIRGGGHHRNLMAGQCSVVADNALVACTIPYLAVLVLCQSGDVAHEIGLELINVAAIIGKTRLLRTNPQQVGIVDINTLNTDDILGFQVAVGTARLDEFHLVVVDRRTDKSGAVCANPDISVEVFGTTERFAVGSRNTILI